MQIPLKQISNTLDTSIVSLDQTRSADLTELSQVRSAKFAGLARDRARLAAKLGETDPRVIGLDRSLALHKDVLNGYLAESAAASATPPKIDARSWALHGNVVDATRAAIEGITVALYQGDAWDQRAGYACTDADGYFALQVADASKVDTPFSIHLLKYGKSVYVDQAPVTIRPAHVEYREIVLGSKSAGTCEPPPDPRRNPPSVPPTKKATPPVTKRPASTK